MRLAGTSIVAAVMIIHQSALAAPNDYEIDLKELPRITRHHSADAEQRQHKRRTEAEPQTGKTDKSGNESVYVVQPGEHLYLILMKKYGLSDPEAGRLIPKVMQLNGISSPKGLKAGQRLRIPLPAGGRSRSAASRDSVAAFRSEPPAAAPAGPAQPAPPQVSQPAAHPLEAEIVSVLSEPSCKLARNLVKKMGLLASSSSPGIKGVESVEAAVAGRSVTVICGLSEAERYTYERLLAPGGRQLLFFAGNDSADCVVKKLADSLGLTFQKRDSDTSALPQTYIFPPFGSRTQELHLIIFPPGQPKP